MLSAACPARIGRAISRQALAGSRLCTRWSCGLCCLVSNPGLFVHLSSEDWWIAVCSLRMAPDLLSSPDHSPLKEESCSESSSFVVPGHSLLTARWSHRLCRCMAVLAMSLALDGLCFSRECRVCNFTAATPGFTRPFLFWLVQLGVRSFDNAAAATSSPNWVPCHIHCYKNSYCTSCIPSQSHLPSAKIKSDPPQREWLRRWND